MRLHVRQLTTIAVLLCWGLLCLTNCINCGKRDVVSEFEKTYAYYGTSQDTLKLWASQFIIRNFFAHKYLSGQPINKIDSIARYVSGLKGYSDFDNIALLVDSVICNTYFEYNDIKLNSSDSLFSFRKFKRDLDFAVSTWQNVPWRDQVDFNDFCEYVLPSQLDVEPFGNLRKKLFKKYYPLLCKKGNIDELHTAFSYVLTLLEDYNAPLYRLHYFLPLSVKNVGILKAGDCFQTGLLKVMVLRALGIPATLDWVPAWGNYPGSHAQVTLIPRHGSRRLLTNNNLPESTNDVFEMSYFMDFNDLNLYNLPPINPQLDIHYNKTIPKVYRYTWSAQPERIKLFRTAMPGELLSQFKLYHKDVTAEYLACRDVRVPISSSPKYNRIAYLAVYNGGVWAPVAASLINEDQTALFADVGLNIVYLPMVCRRGILYPAGPPFVNAKNGRHSIETDVRKTQKVKLYSKYPLFSYSAVSAIQLYGSEILVGMERDISKAKIVHTIDKYAFYTQKIEIELANEIRYVFFRPRAPYSTDISEFVCYEKINGYYKKITGTLFCKSNQTDSSLRYLVDDDLSTSYNGGADWFSLDLGEPKNGTIKILYCPKNDGNCIIPGNIYELFYWGRVKWVSLGTQMATVNHLVFNNVPGNSLLLLKCLSRGDEERIFTYENNRQIWW